MKINMKTLKNFLTDKNLRFLYLAELGFFNKMDDKTYLEKKFKARAGYPLNLNNPQTFNEKIQWLKLYDRKPEYTTMVDKYAVKEYVAKIIGEKYIIPTLGVWDNFDDIDFSRLPKQFVLKCTHDSGGLVICRNKSSFDKNAAKRKINKSLKKDYYLSGREWPYKDVPRKIIAEKYMVDESGTELKDYKIFNFDGKPRLIQVDYGRFVKHMRNLYTIDWKYVEGEIEYPTDKNHIISRPDTLDEMLRISEILAKGIPHVRTDFYSVNGQIYFGELTFYHESGYGHFRPKKMGEALGKLITLPSKSILFYVLVPVYKVENYLDACINSVLNQTYDNWQLVLVDDGSPDRCGEICDSYARKNKKIHVIHQDNMGQIAARQSAMRFVRQQSGLNEQETYILYLDADDTFKPGALQVLHDNIASSGCDLLVFGMDRVVDGKIVSAFDVKHAFIGTITDKRELYNLVLSDAAYNSLCRKAIRFSVFSETDYSAEYYYIRHGEDLLQSLSIYKNSHKAEFIKESLYNYTVNPTSVTQSIRYENFKIDSTVRSKVLEFIKNENVMSASDIRRYMDYCRKMMTSSVKTVAAFHVGYAEKKKIYERICNDEYYGALLADTTAGNVLLWLLKHQCYHAVIWTSKLGLLVGMMKRGVRHHSKGKD